MKHIHDFLLDEEGYTLYGYVPNNDGEVIGQSGLTIAAGVDFGQMDRHEFNEVPMSVTARHVLTPFVRVKGAPALRLLSEKGRVKVTVEDAAAISNYIFDKTTEQVREKYHEFLNLPENAQTVLVSLAYNLGLNGSPSTSGKVASRRFTEAISELRDPREWANRELDGRRNREADLLEAILS